jgi:L-fucose isomerase-like protein
MPVPPRKITLGFVPANRGFFSAELARQMRQQTLDALARAGVEVIVPNEQQMPHGCVETIPQAEFCAELFRRHDIQGIVIGAMNFGDEQSAAWVVKRSGLNVPIFVFGGQEETTLSRKMDRRDSFCGLLSIGEGLRQIGAKYSLGKRPICFPGDPSFAEDIAWFTGVCRVVHGLRNARYGQLGARPEAFWTCRFDEKALQKLGPTTVVLDLSEVIANVAKISDGDPDVKRIMKEVNAYADTSLLVDASLVRMAKFELFLRRWKEANAIDAFAIQCWTSIQHNYGICTCTTMSRMGEEGVPAACEADILGTMSMHACQLASGTPAALADWNNLHNDDDELVNVWHCGVYPASMAKAKPKIGTHGVLVPSGATPAEGSQGVCEFVMAESPITLSRITQDEGRFKGVVVHGQIEDNTAETFGAYGWARIPNLDRLYRDVLMVHFPHHVAMTQGHVGNVLWEAFGKYLGMDVFHPTQEAPGVYTPRMPFANASAAVRV